MYIGESEAHVENLIKDANAADLMNVNVIFEDSRGCILGEVQEINSDVIKIRFLGEYINGKYVNGVLRKPLLSYELLTFTPPNFACVTCPLALASCNSHSTLLAFLSFT